MQGESQDAMRSFHAANNASLLVLLYFITICVLLKAVNGLVRAFVYVFKYILDAFN